VQLLTYGQNYAVVQATLPGIENLGFKFWIVWAVICAAFIPITYLFYPETANRTLEDIDRFFETKPSIIIARNGLATQLQRPEVYIRQDEEITRHVEKGDGWDEEKGGNGVDVKQVE
jgi:hypothetical protein